LILLLRELAILKTSGERVGQEVEGKSRTEEGRRITF